MNIFVVNNDVYNNILEYFNSVSDGDVRSTLAVLLVVITVGGCTTVAAASPVHAVLDDAPEVKATSPFGELPVGGPEPEVDDRRRFTSVSINRSFLNLAAVICSVEPAEDS